MRFLIKTIAAILASLLISNYNKSMDNLDKDIMVTFKKKDTNSLFVSLYLINKDNEILYDKICKFKVEKNKNNQSIDLTLIKSNNIKQKNNKINMAINNFKNKNSKKNTQLTFKKFYTLENDYKENSVLDLPAFKIILNNHNKSEIKEIAYLMEKYKVKEKTAISIAITILDLLTMPNSDFENKKTFIERFKIKRSENVQKKTLIKSIYNNLI